MWGEPCSFVTPLRVTPGARCHSFLPRSTASSSTRAPDLSQLYQPLNLATLVSLHHPEPGGLWKPSYLREGPQWMLLRSLGARPPRPRTRELHTYSEPLRLLLCV